MINRIAGIDFNSSTDDVPVTPSLDWSRLIWWMTPLAAVANDEADWSVVNFPKLRQDIQASGILVADDAEWAEREGGLPEAIARGAARDLTYLRKAVSALFYADERNPLYFPKAVETGAMFALVRRAHTLVTTLQIIEELITGVSLES